MQIIPALCNSFQTQPLLFKYKKKIGGKLKLLHVI